MSEDGESKDWISPSDLLIGKLDLKPPFTSKVTRGKTHEGIIGIANKILDKQRQRFLIYLASILKNNEDAWKDALEREKEAIDCKVKHLYDAIFKAKSKIISEEVSDYYENSLQELENCARDELRNVLIGRHASLLSDLNSQIFEKLQTEKKILTDVLQKKYDDEIAKVTNYYDLLLKDQLEKHEELLNTILFERNEALKAFVNQIEAENQTSTMYVMSLERKKCDIKNFTLKKYQAAEIKGKLEKIKEKQVLINDYQQNRAPLTDINKEWEAKLRKILELFIKFISFSLQILPEQSAFLLDLEKLFMLQLTEMQKTPKQQSPSILLDIDETFKFKFPNPLKESDECTQKPFEIEGDPSDPKRKVYGSTETIPSDVDLPLMTVNREFVYAKCHNYEEIQNLWEATRCKCYDPILVVNPKKPSKSRDSYRGTSLNLPPWHPVGRVSSATSFDTLLVEDPDRLSACPARRCQKLFEEFPYLYNYIDYTEENYERVKKMLSSGRNIQYVKMKPAKAIAEQGLVFEKTLELTHDVGTQYSSQESLELKTAPSCKCTEGFIRPIYRSEESKEDLQSKEWQCKTQVNTSLLDFIAKGRIDF